MLSNIWVWDPGSGKNVFRIPDPWVKKALDPGSRIRIRNTAILLRFLVIILILLKLEVSIFVFAFLYKRLFMTNLSFLH
jgi:hypothetical protein